MASDLDRENIWIYFLLQWPGFLLHKVAENIYLEKQQINSTITKLVFAKLETRNSNPGITNTDSKGMAGAIAMRLNQ